MFRQMEVELLLSNDDGVQSGFLWYLADALSRHFRVAVAAPATEQSWIGRALSRRKEVTVERLDDRPFLTYAINGTPSDCVNIALAHLLPNQPRLVVSGINIGYNTAANLIYSSGTIAAALEGAFWGLPAYAVSQEIPPQDFEVVNAARGVVDGPIGERVRAHAEHAASWIAAHCAATDSAGRNPSAIVHNLNYPARPQLPMEVVLSQPVLLEGTSLFEEDSANRFTFRYSPGQPRPATGLTDRGVLATGKISHSVLNFSQTSGDLNG